jgi:hypothetical protein
MPDYTNQLDEIVRLLSRPGISPWILAAFSVFLGIIGGAIGRAFEPWLADFPRRSRMRRVLYADMASMFFQVDVITMFGEPWANDNVRAEAFTRLVSSLDFEAEDHLKTNRDVFMQLDERPAAKHIYHLLHQTVSEGAAQMENNCRKVQWMLGWYVHDRAFHERYFRKFLPKNQSARLIKRATGIYDQSIKQEEDRQKQNEKYLNA